MSCSLLKMSPTDMDALKAWYFEGKRSMLIDGIVADGYRSSSQKEIPNDLLKNIFDASDCRSRVHLCKTNSHMRPFCYEKLHKNKCIQEAMNTKYVFEVQPNEKGNLPPTILMPANKVPSTPQVGSYFVLRVFVDVTFEYILPEEEFHGPFDGEMKRVMLHLVPGIPTRERLFTKIKDLTEVDFTQLESMFMGVEDIKEQVKNTIFPEYDLYEEEPDDTSYDWWVDTIRVSGIEVREHFKDDTGDVLYYDSD